jgi:hypothetical protein
MTDTKQPTLAELRKKALEAFEDHELDMATKHAYARAAKREDRKRVKAQGNPHKSLSIVEPKPRRA